MIKLKRSYTKSYRIIVTCIILLLIINLTSIYFLPKGKLDLCWSNQTDSFINAYSLSNTGKYIAVGTSSGQLLIYDNDGKTIINKTIKDPILDIKFSYNEKFVYIRSYSLYALNIEKNSIVWEKFRPNHYIDNFWTFRNGNIGAILESKTDLVKYYLFLDSKGASIKESKLPDIYGRYSITPSNTGNHLLLSSKDGNIYDISNEGYVNWNIHLEPPVSELNSDYPIVHDISNDGDAIVAYSYEQYGKKGNLVNYFNSTGEILWQKDYVFHILEVKFSPDYKKVIILNENGAEVYKINEKILYRKKQYGYNIIDSEIFSTNILLASKRNETDNIYYKNKYIIFQLISLENGDIIWQMRKKFDKKEYVIKAEGLYFLELDKPFKLKLYKFIKK